MTDTMPWFFTEYPLLEVLTLIVSMVAAGMLLQSYLTAKEEHAKNVSIGLEGSLGLTSMWRVRRDRHNFVNQIVISLSTLLVLGWRYEHLPVPSYVWIYISRNLSLLFLAGRGLQEAWADREARRDITYAVQAEYRRSMQSGGRRATDQSAARMNGILDNTRISGEVHIEGNVLKVDSEKES